MIVELGAANLGPTLELTHQPKMTDEPESLIPTIGSGLYDAYDFDFGVPWALPLSHFHRV